MNQMDVTNKYQNFRAALYVRAIDLAPLCGDITPFVEKFTQFSHSIKISKVYIETHRDMVIPSEDTLTAVRDYLNEIGVETSAGITVTINEKNSFQTYCYSDPFYRQKLTEVVQLSARLFDEVVFDDFFFTNCKCPKCIEAKGSKSWTEFRLEQMTQASKELVLAPARKINPNVQVVIKYPNWYEHFHGLGFNLKDQPPLYDGIYTGNETRDPQVLAQHLQPYESYLIFRYFENIKPGGNRGGWVDPFAVKSLDRYAEQLWLTLFSKSPEITLFDYFSIQLPILESQRGAWQDLGTSFDFDAVTAPLRLADGSLPPDANMALAAGAALRHADQVVGHLGNPVGVKAYRPYHSRGEDFIHNYIGMLGIPMDLVPAFPADAPILFLNESTAHDKDIISKIKTQLMDGKTVIITTGLVKALQDKGIQDIVEITYTDRKISGNEYQIGRFESYVSDKSITIPVIDHFTNDSFDQISCVSGASGASIFHVTSYGRGKLYILTIPDNYSDLYNLPAGVLSNIRKVFTKELYVLLDAPAQVSLFVYDNDTFIVESFLPEYADIRIELDSRFTSATDILSSKVFACEPVSAEAATSDTNGFNLPLKPHSFIVFRAK
jgi:hypothetical protein